MDFVVLILLLLTPSVQAASEEKAPENVCVQCHLELGDEMARPVTLWQESIHHKMGNSCEGCHGGDPTDGAAAMDPKSGFVGVPRPQKVAEFCGKCHVGVKENYLKSAHHQAALQGTGPTCITCHHSHDVQQASFDLINETLCAQCHSYDNGQKMKRAFVSAEMALTKRKAELKFFNKRGILVKPLEEQLFALRNSLHQMTHTLNIEDINEKTKGVMGALDQMNQELDVFRKKLHKRWWIGSLVALFFIALVIVLIRLHKSYEQEQ